MKIQKIANQQELAQASMVFQQTWQAAYQGLLPAAGLAALKADDWVARLSQPGRRNLIAVVDQRVVGVVSYGQPRQGQPLPAGCGELIALYVLPDFQGQGVGQRLFGRAEQGLRTEYSLAMLSVLSTNLPAQHFYFQRGWRVSGRQISREIFGRLVTLTQLTRMLA